MRPEPSSATSPRGYGVMTYARCGATWLAQLAGSTGMLGRPEDWFNGKGYRDRGVADYPLDREGQIARMRTQGASANGIYGIKLSAVRCDELRGFDWAGEIGPLAWIHLTRADRLGRAISDVRAQQTGQYRSTSVATAEPRYDSAMIRAALAQQAADEARVRQFFALSGIMPLELTYEALRADPGGVLGLIATHLGLEERPVADAAQVTLAVQGDDLNEAWRARFLAEQAPVNYLPTLREGRGWRQFLAGR